MGVTESWQKSGNAEFSASWGLSAGIVSVCGEIDAANAEQFAAYVQRCLGNCGWRIVDLSGVDYIAVSGFNALQRLDFMSGRRGTSWAMVPSRAVSRLLEICDPDGALPTIDIEGAKILRGSLPESVLRSV